MEDTEPQEQTYFVRLGREVEGPFTVEQIERRLKINLFSTYHEVSADGDRWVPLSEDYQWVVEPQEAQPEPTESMDLSGLAEPEPEPEPKPTPVEFAWLDDDEDQQPVAPVAQVPGAYSTAGRLPAAPNQNALPGAKPVSLFTRSLLVSCGSLLIAIASVAFYIDGQDFAAWWTLEGPLGITFAVWGIVGLLLFGVAWAPRSKQRGWIVGGLAGTGFLAATGALRDDPAMRMNTLLWLITGPSLGWAIAAQAVRIWRDPNRKERGVWSGQGAALGISGAAAWLSAVAVVLSNPPLSTLILLAVGVSLLPLGFVSWRMLQFTVPSLGICLAMFVGTITLLLATAAIVGVQQSSHPQATGQSLTPMLLITAGMTALTAAIAAARLDHRRVHGASAPTGSAAQLPAPTTQAAPKASRPDKPRKTSKSSPRPFL